MPSQVAFAAAAVFPTRTAPSLPRARFRSRTAPRATASGAGAARLLAVRGGIDCALEDFVTSGSNIAVGGGEEAHVRALAQALSARVETGVVVDAAFVPVSAAARAALDEFALPRETAVNHGALDLYLGCVTQMDAELNAALGVAPRGGAPGLRTERVASQLAAQSVVVIHEADYAATATGLTSFPVLLDPLFARRTAQSIRGNDTLGGMGVADVREREDGSGVADVLLTPSSDVMSIDTLLADFQGVHAVGILPATPTVTAVVATETEAYDVTSSLAGIVNLSNGVEITSPGGVSPLPGDGGGSGGAQGLPRLSAEERAKALRELGAGWRIASDGREGLVREFRFGSVEQSHAFVGRILRIARLARSYPEITTTFNRIHVRLATLESHGVTKLDVAMAREIGVFCDLLHGCATV